MLDILKNMVNDKSSDFFFSPSEACFSFGVEPMLVLAREYKRSLEGTIIRTDGYK